MSSYAVRISDWSADVFSADLHCRGEAVITRQGGAMRQVIRGLGRLEDAAGILAAIVMFLIMVIATTDVMLRYVFNSPFSWSYDFIGLYLMTEIGRAHV